MTSSDRDLFNLHLSPNLDSSEAFHDDQSSGKTFEILNPPSSDQKSENPFESGDISDEKRALDLFNSDKSVIEPPKDQHGPAYLSYSPGFDERPCTARSSSYTPKDGKHNSHRESRRFYMEEDSEFHTEMDDGSDQHGVYDDDDDWEESALKKKKRFKSLCCHSFSIRGMLNMSAVIILALGLIIIFGVLPIFTYRSLHLQTAPLRGSGDALGSVDDSNTLRHTATRRGFHGSSNVTSLVSDELPIVDKSPQPAIKSVSKFVHHLNQWEDHAGKNFKGRPILRVEEGTSGRRSKKRSQRKTIHTEP